MNIKRVAEFFEGDNKRLSMTRLLAFMSFFPASSVLGVSHSDTALTVYLSAYVVQLVGGKTADAWMQKVKNATPNRSVK